MRRNLYFCPPSAENSTDKRSGKPRLKEGKMKGAKRTQAPLRTPKTPSSSAFEGVRSMVVRHDSPAWIAQYADLCDGEVIVFVGHNGFVEISASKPIVAGNVKHPSS
ncbi:hypothetical protein RB195_019372 [Necator americanus]|uniref:Uncharacterized protein n=1 Tax=Necator americanus TaxID=51031 RepID=A0ABR1CET4_NECAM